MTKFFTHPSTTKPGRTDWIEYMMDPVDKRGYPRCFRINLSWMLSNWRCSYGSCPGILVSGAKSDVSCCQIGVGFGVGGPTAEKKEEWARVRRAVHELTPEDWDHGYGKDKQDRYWTLFEVKTTRRPKHKRRDTHALAVESVPEATKVVDGGCIFANRENGPAGKPGCAFHHLAARTGRHHSETKPDVCWMIPFAVGSNHEEDIMVDVITVSGTPAAMWGAQDTESTEMIGHWCTEIPDHFTGTEPVYKYAETELRKIMGDPEYDRMVEEIEKAGPRRYPMPGEVLAEKLGEGRKLLPLLVKRRQTQWEAEGKTAEAKSAEEWLEKHG